MTMKPAEYFQNNIVKGSHETYIIQIKQFLEEHLYSIL